MAYIDKYPGRNGCPVEEFCGTVISCVRLCHSLNDDISSKESSHVLILSDATSEEKEANC